MAMFQQLQQMMGKGGPKGGSAAPAASPGGDDTNWKKEFAEAFAKHQKRTLVKSAYETVEVQGGVPKMYQSTLTVDGVQYSGDTSNSKKKAEHEAAKVALQALFPDRALSQAAGGWGSGGGDGSDLLLQVVSMLMGNQGPAWGAPGVIQGGGDGDGGKKRKANRSTSEELPPKSKLMQGLSLLNGRPTTKQDYAVTFADKGDGQHQATFTFNSQGHQLSFKGQMSESKKAAETSACEAALKGLKGKLDPAVEQHQAKKKQKNQEALAALKEKTAAQKAAKKAA